MGYYNVTCALNDNKPGDAVVENVKTSILDLWLGVFTLKTTMKEFYFQKCHKIQTFNIMDRSF